MNAAGQEPSQVGQWLAQLHSESASTRAGRGGARLVQLMSREPQFASYASVGELAARTGIHPSSVTRIAQALGFEGWPSLRAALREVYVSSPADRQHAVGAGANTGHATEYEFDNLRALGTPAAQEVIQLIGAAVRDGRQTLVVGSGLAVAPGSVLGNLGLMTGVNIRFSADPATTQLALAAALGPDDCVIGINVWRMPRVLYEVIGTAHERGATTCLITDTPGSRLGRKVDHLLYVPSGTDTTMPSVAAMTAATTMIVRHAMGTNGAAHARDVERLWERAQLMDEHE